MHAYANTHCRYHWSVEYFEDLRNINHCESIVMKRNEDNGKYVLQNELRTWSELKRRAAAAESQRNAMNNHNTSPTSNKNSASTMSSQSPVAVRKWGGCAEGCNHNHMNFPRRTRRQNTQEYGIPPAPIPESNEKSDHPVAPKTGAGDAPPPQFLNGTSDKTKPNKHTHDEHHDSKAENEAGSSPAADAAADADGETSPISPEPTDQLRIPYPARHHHRPSILKLGRDFGGSRSGAVTPADVLSDDSDYFSSEANGSNKNANKKLAPTNLGMISKKLKQNGGADASAMERKKSWAEESGMGSGARADALGDQTEDSDLDTGDGDGEETPGTGRSATSEVELAEMRDKSLRGSVY